MLIIAQLITLLVHSKRPTLMPRIVQLHKVKLPPKLNLVASLEQANSPTRHSSNNTKNCSTQCRAEMLLLASSQVANPTFQSTQPTAIGITPIMQGAGLQGQESAAGQSAKSGKMGSGLMAAGTAAAAFL